MLKKNFSFRFINFNSEIKEKKNDDNNSLKTKLFLILYQLTNQITKFIFSADSIIILFEMKKKRIIAFSNRSTF